MKIDFDAIDWEVSPLGSRIKAVEIDDRKIRLVELRKADGDAEWCETGHIGFVVEGDLNIEFDDKSLNFKKGDAIYIRSGESNRHKPHALTGNVLLFLTEEI